MDLDVFCRVIEPTPGRGRGRPRGRPSFGSRPREPISVAKEITSATNEVTQAQVTLGISKINSEQLEQPQTPQGIDQQNAIVTDNQLQQQQQAELGTGEEPIVSKLDPKLSALIEAAPTDQPAVDLSNLLQPIQVTRTQIPDIPVFCDESDKLSFEENLSIDLTLVDDMYKSHIIEQDVNENAPPPGSRTSNELSIFSCNECEKVFMTLSHMRLHCFTHTDIKPFKCHKCNYASNSKG